MSDNGYEPDVCSKYWIFIRIFSVRSLPCQMVHVSREFKSHLLNFLTNSFIANTRQLLKRLLAITR